MTDLGCKCTGCTMGTGTTYPDCANTATQEDGYCDNCRANGGSLPAGYRRDPDTGVAEPIPGVADLLDVLKDLMGVNDAE